MNVPQVASARWRKSSYSTTHGTDCVEIAPLVGDRRVLARDSKNPTGAVLSFMPAVWSVFLDEAKRGVFDL